MEEDQTQAALRRLRELAQSENEQVALKAAVELLNRESSGKDSENDRSWILKDP